MRDSTHWSAPTKVPDLASPIYCSCLHHSFNPTRRMLRIVRNSEGIIGYKGGIIHCKIKHVSNLGRNWRIHARVFLFMINLALKKCAGLSHKPMDISVHMNNLFLYLWPWKFGLPFEAPSHFSNVMSLTLQQRLLCQSGSKALQVMVPKLNL